MPSDAPATARMSDEEFERRAAVLDDLSGQDWMRVNSIIAETRRARTREEALEQALRGLHLFAREAARSRFNVCSRCLEIARLAALALIEKGGRSLIARIALKASKP